MDHSKVFLLSSLQYCFYSTFWVFGHEVCGILAPNQRSNPHALRWKVNVPSDEPLNHRGSPFSLASSASSPKYTRLKYLPSPVLFLPQSHCFSTGVGVGVSFVSEQKSDVLGDTLGVSAGGPGALASGGQTPGCCSSSYNAQGSPLLPPHRKNYLAQDVSGVKAGKSCPKQTCTRLPLSCCLSPDSKPRCCPSPAPSLP